MQKKITRQLERKIVHLYQTGKSTGLISQTTGIGVRKVLYSVQKAHAEWGELPDDSPMPIIYEDFLDIENKRLRKIRAKQDMCLHSIMKCPKCGIHRDNSETSLQSEIKRLRGVIIGLESQLKANKQHI
jgi:hypothetical protein